MKALREKRREKAKELSGGDVKLTPEKGSRETRPVANDADCRSGPAGVKR
jgi:hypothetical protein